MHSVVQHAEEFYKKHSTADESTLDQLEDFFYKLLRVSDKMNLFVNRLMVVCLN